MSAWIVQRYIRKCPQSFPFDVSRLFDNITTITDLRKAVSVTINRRLDTALYDSWVTFLIAEFSISCNLPKWMNCARSCAHAMSETTKIDSRLSLFSSAVAFLHVARKISGNNFGDELLDVLAAFIGQDIGTRLSSKQTSSLSLLRKAAKLMAVVAKTSLSTNMQLIEIELSKFYLHRALTYDDFDGISIYCLSNVYLAVLCYTTGQFQSAIDHCTLVLRSQDHSQCSSHVVQGELLPKIDDNIDTVLGLSAFYQHVRTLALNRQQEPDARVFTTELFAYYLLGRCLSVKYGGFMAHMSPADEMFRQGKYISDVRQVVIGDVLIVKLSGIRSRNKPVTITGYEVQSPTSRPVVPCSSDLVELLYQSAVERLTDYRLVEMRDFGSVVAIMPTDFQALYAYKRGDYQ